MNVLGFKVIMVDSGIHKLEAYLSKSYVYTNLYFDNYRHVNQEVYHGAKEFVENCVMDIIENNLNDLNNFVNHEDVINVFITINDLHIVSVYGSDSIDEYTINNDYLKGYL